MLKTVTSPASPSAALINMSATPSAGRGRALEPRPADSRHRLVPHYRNPNSIDPNIGRVAGKRVPFFTPLEPGHCTFNQRAALQQRPDVETRVGFDEVIERKVIGVSVVVEQSEATDHGVKSKRAGGYRTRL
jgi:hypothetical protein